MPWKDKMKQAAYSKRYRLANYELIKTRSKQWRDQNKENISIRASQARLKLKTNAFDAYGGQTCFWCGENDLMSLVIDHMANNGAQHRDKYGRKIAGSRIYQWLKKNNYPPGFQILCMNCNLTKSLNNGILPPNRKNLCSQKIAERNLENTLENTEGKTLKESVKSQN